MAGKVEDESIDVSEEIAELMEMGEEERKDYCKNVIRAVADGFKEIAEMKHKVKQARALKGYMAEIKEQMKDIRVVVLYTIKREFREMYIDLLEEFSEMGL